MEQRPSSALTTEEDGMGPPASGGGGGGGGGDEGGDKPPKSVLLSVCSFILITEFCERLSYYGMSGSLVYLFQNRLGLTNSEVREKEERQRMLEAVVSASLCLY